MQNILRKKITRYSIILSGLENIIYAVTAVITILWSVWIYILWSERVGLSEDSDIRYILMILPSSLFLLIVFSNWRSGIFIRLDLISLVLLDVITVSVSFILLLVLNIKSINSRKGYILALFLYFITSVLLVAGIFTVKFYPPLLIRVYQVIEEGKSIDLGNLTWSLLNPENHENALESMTNKILLALFTYIPLSLARFFYSRRQMKKLVKRIEDLEASLKRVQNKRP